MASRSEAPFRLTLQERSFPVPTGSPSQTIDWLPEYYGYGWVAFASCSSLVISIAKSPTRKDEVDLAICQVLDAPQDAPAAHITCVRWAPPLAHVAASCEHLLWIYTPQLSQPYDEASPSDFPQGWVLSHKLEHTFKVQSFSWTELGDGVLSVGTKVVMWRQNERGWYQLWTSDVTNPQSFAAATLSAKGLAATAEGNFSASSMEDAQVDDCNRSVVKRKVTVWWWEDSLGLLESELVHPQEVLFIQWRPSKRPFTLQEAFRPVLMTSCKDGAVRLWLEIDSGRARLDKALGKDVSAKHLKPAYFVSAVIEAEHCLHGILGVDVFVSWPLECRPRDCDGAVTESASGSSIISKRESIGACEWLLGVGPEGSVCLWSVFCLDDIYPPRCPRVFLWKQSNGVLPSPALSAGSKLRQVLIKVVSQRLGNGRSDPPSALDLFYTSELAMFQWSRLWPPVTALCGDLPKETVVSEAVGPEIAPGKVRKDVWGVVTECFIFNGHVQDIINIASHPIAYTGLVATLDSQGCIFLWCTLLLMNRKLSLCVSIWKPSGQLSVSLESVSLTWLPAVFPEGRTVLLVAHAKSVDCYLVSEGSNATYGSLLLEVKLLSRFTLHTDDAHQRLDSIWALPVNSQNREFLIIWKASGEVFWHNLEIVVKEASCYVRDQGSDPVKGPFNVAVSTSSRLKSPGSVSCIVIAPTSFVPFTQTLAGSLAFEPLALSRPYDVISGSSDGMVRLWKKNCDVDTVDGAWLCVGFLKVCSGPVVVIAVGSSGFKIATWSPDPLELYGEGLLIWDIEGLTDAAIFNLSGRLQLTGCPTSVQWLDLGNGGSLLGVMLQYELQVYAESHAYSKGFDSFSDGQKSGKQGSLQSSWFLLASVPLLSNASGFTWGPKGSLLVPFKEHLLVYGPWISPDKMAKNPFQVDLSCLLESQLCQTWSLIKVGQSLSSSLPIYHPMSILYHLYTGNQQRARVCLLYLQQNLSRRSLLVDDKASCSLLQIYSPNQLLEIFQMEPKAGMKTDSKQTMSLTWSAGLGRAFDDDLASFSTMSLEGNGGVRAAAESENEISSVLNIEKLESCLKIFSQVLDLTEDQAMQLVTIAHVLVILDTESKALEYGSLDLFGQRFWLAVQLLQGDHCRKTGSSGNFEALNVESKAMAWALQSDCKDTLLDLCMGIELSWPAMRALGAGFWLTDVSQLRMRIEKLARAQYLMEKNPRHCALLYLALQRKNVLMGLFKLSKDDKDRVLYEFLGRDFLVEKNRAAALKNAYVLLGKHQHDLAAAFFLLGGDLGSAASACAKNLRDLQLAFVICRLIEGINGPTEQRLIREYALPNAQNAGDHWLASLFQGLLGEHFKAIEELAGRLTISETMMESENQEDESNVSTISSDRIAGVFEDPQVGLFCLHLASKPVMQSGLSAASTAAICKWLTIKTSVVLERLGLSLEALEYLSSAKDSVWAKPQSKRENVYVAAVTACKTRLALRYQAQVLQAHPCWWLEQHTKLGHLRSSLLSTNSTQREFSEMAANGTSKLLQCLNLLQSRFAVDTNHIVGEFARWAYDQNMLYLQYVFTRGTTKETQSTKDTLFVPFFMFVDHCAKGLKDRWFRTIDPLSLCSFQLVVSTTGLGSRMDADECSPLDATDSFLLAIDLWLLLGQQENMEVNVEIILLILVLYSVAAWKKSHWNALGFVLKLTKSFAATLCVSLHDIEAAFKVYVASNDIVSARTFCKVTLHLCSDLGQMTEFEVWHVLGLAFWDAFSGWAKQLLKNESSGVADQIPGASSPQLSLQKRAAHKDVLKALQSVSSFFQKKLVFYLNSTVNTTSLRNWLLHNHNVKINSLNGSPRQTSSAIESTDTSHLISLSPSSSMSSQTDEVYKELLIPNHIRSILELGGAKIATSIDKGALGSLKSPRKDLLKPVKRNGMLESAPHDQEGATSEIYLGSVMPNGNNETAIRSAASERRSLSTYYQNGEEIFHSSGDLLEAVCVNSCCPEQVVVSSSRKGLLYIDLNTGKSFSVTDSNLWTQAEWPRNGWANSESTPIPTVVSPGVGLKSKEGPSLGLGGASVGLGVATVGKESSFKGAGVGIPGYGGMGAWGLGWEDWEDFDGVIDPLATIDNVSTQAIDSHPLRPLFLVGSRNTHVYLWEFGKSSATATYGILPAANVPPPYALASISSVKFDHSGHRFATSAIDGTVCTWQLEVGGRSNVRPTDSCLCFDRHATDVAFVGGSGGIIAATGASQNDNNLVFWDTLAPPTTSQASVFCHEGGARCLELFDHNIGGGSISSLIVTCGKGGDIAVHDFRYITSGKTKRAKHVKKEQGPSQENQSSRRQQDGELNVNGSVWYIAKAHSGSISCVSAIPRTSLFFTGSKDGSVKLWDANKCELVNQWQKVHDKHMFLQHNARGFGAVVQPEYRGFGGFFQAAVTDIQPVSCGFVTCGGDGTLKLFRHQEH